VPGVVVACPCGEVFELKPEYAGRWLECPSCGRHLRAGRASGAARAEPADPAFDRDLFLLRERVLTIRAAYEVWAEDGTPILFVERPTYPLRTGLAWIAGALAAVALVGGSQGLAAAAGPLGPLVELGGLVLAPVTFFGVSLSARPRRHVTVYRDDTRREVLLRVLQDQRLAGPTRTYTVLTGAGVKLARLRKRYLDNLVRKRWDVETADGRLVARAVEDSVVLSLLRRVVGTLFGLLRTNFVLVDGEGLLLGEFNRKFTILDRYVLDLRTDPERRLDRRVAVALGVMLDTGERR
jgi:uncharacterized protein YxjI